AGASTRNAGFACFGSATELLRDANEMGDEAMLSLVEMRYKGIQHITRTFKKKSIDFIPCGGYELISPVIAERYTDLRDRVKKLNRQIEPVFGKKKAFTFNDRKIEKFGFTNARHLLFNEEEGALHPGKLCASLIKMVRKMGVNILSGMEITAIQEKGSGVAVNTARGIEISARQLLICTNGFVRQLVPGLDVVPARGQVLLTSPIPGLK